MRLTVIVVRLAIAALVVAAVVGQLLTSLDYWTTVGVEHIWLSIVNFFSFFTIEANVFGAIVFTLGAVLALRRLRSGAETEDPYWFTAIRGAAVAYLVTTGIVYNLLLRGIELPQGSTLGWSNEVLHAVFPVYALLDWLFAPGRGRLDWRALWGMLVFPIVWAVYTLVRAPFTPNEVTGDPYWYPYPFLNPAASANGYLSVAFYVILIAAVIGLVAAGVIRISRRARAGSNRAAEVPTTSL